MRFWTILIFIFSIGLTVHILHIGHGNHDFLIVWNVGGLAISICCFLYEAVQELK